MTAARAIVALTALAGTARADDWEVPAMAPRPTTSARVMIDGTALLGVDHFTSRAATAVATARLGFGGWALSLTDGVAAYDQIDTRPSPIAGRSGGVRFRNGVVESGLGIGLAHWWQPRDGWAPVAQLALQRQARTSFPAAALEIPTERIVHDPRALLAFGARRDSPTWTLQLELGATATLLDNDEGPDTAYGLWSAVTAARHLGGGLSLGGWALGPLGVLRLESAATLGLGATQHLGPGALSLGASVRFAAAAAAVEPDGPGLRVMIGYAAER